MQPTAYVPIWNSLLTILGAFIFLCLGAMIVGLFLYLREIDRELADSRKDIIKREQEKWRERRYEVPRRTQKQQHRIRPL